MQILSPRFDRSTFFTSVSESAKSLLLLDYDGTLAPFRPERTQAVPYEGVRERLTRLIASKNTRVVIVSGRWTKDLIPLIGLDKLPEIWGCHGAERLSADGAYSITPLPEHVVAGLVAAEDWARAEGLESYCERKPISVAFHWRGLPAATAEDIKRRVTIHFSHAVGTPSLELKNFDGGLELKYTDITKARAVRSLLGEVSDNTPLAYLGDDMTDEDAFAALDGRGVRVLVRKELRPTAADLWIVPPTELLEFLDDWLGATE
ncbi:trehalose-phosphatase [bacterium]|nr:trehalose-phosphatase [bacterium]